MIRQKLFFTGDPDYDPWAESVNGLIDIAHHKAERGDIEEAKKMASEIQKILDETYERQKKTLGDM